VKFGGKYTDNGQELMKINIVPNDHAENPSLRDLAGKHPNKIVSQTSIKSNVTTADHMSTTEYMSATEHLFQDLANDVLDK